MIAANNMGNGKSEMENRKWWVRHIPSPISHLPCRSSCSGQGTIELIIILPLLIILAGGVLSVAYICWQGVKTQEAANLAARIEGQERVAGGLSNGDITSVMGVGSGGDQDPSQLQGQAMFTPSYAKNMRPTGSPNLSTVYGSFRDAARKMFTSGEDEHLFVPVPVRRTISDEISVIRVMTPHPFFGIQIPPVIVKSNAYGGEDTNMYGLPRWGHTGGGTSSGQLYWQQTMQQNPGNDKNATTYK